MGLAFLFNYELMKHIYGDTQMTDVWRLPAVAPWEKTCTKHPTQKPLGLLSRIILASTQAGAWILDPFAGSSTTGIAANLLGRRFLGIERETEFAAISKARREEIENGRTFATYKRKIPDIVKAEVTQMDCFRCCEDTTENLPFLAEIPVAEKNNILMYAVGSAYRKKTEAVGKLAIGVKEGMLNNDDYNNIGYIMFHYWNNDKATPHKLLSTPKLVSKKEIPDGYLLRMATGAERFLLIDYDPNKNEEVGEFDIMKVQRKGKGRYLPFVTTTKEIL